MLTKIRNTSVAVTGLVDLEPSKLKFCCPNDFSMLKLYMKQQFLL